MQAILTKFKSPVLISLLFVVPFMLLEWVNRRSFNEDFPYSLFGFLWLLSLLFFITIMPIIRNIRAGNSLLANPIPFLLRVVFLGCIGWIWLSMVIDQMPCFLGIPNCD